MNIQGVLLTKKRIRLIFKILTNLSNGGSGYNFEEGLRSRNVDFFRRMKWLNIFEFITYKEVIKPVGYRSSKGTAKGCVTFTKLGFEWLLENYEKLLCELWDQEIKSINKIYIENRKKTIISLKEQKYGES